MGVGAYPEIFRSISFFLRNYKDFRNNVVVMCVVVGCLVGGDVALVGVGAYPEIFRPISSFSVEL